ncbi:MAG: nitroreductase family protein [Desulfobacterales bacterium]|nr:nitroreductase family protein [Desulfobacterales bacterium]
MQDLMEVIKGRRSVRKFQDKEIPDDILNNVFEAAKWSQSWANTQCWEIIVIKSNDIKKKLQTAITDKNPAFKAIGAAPIILGICAKLNSSGYYKGIVTTKFGDWFMFDMGLLCQNICLSAHCFGLGSVIVGLFDHDKAKEVLKVKEGYELVTLIPIGYPEKIPSAPNRKEIKDFVHYDVF